MLLLPFCMVLGVPGGQGIWSRMQSFVPPPSAHGLLGLVCSWLAKSCGFEFLAVCTVLHVFLGLLWVQGLHRRGFGFRCGWCTPYLIVFT